MAAKKILVLAINPKDKVHLRLDEEVRQIKAALKLSKGRAKFEVISEGAVRASELHRPLLEHEPQIVHFSGHGTGERGLVAEDKNGKTHLVSTAALDRLFRLCGGVECVVLNACYSVAQVGVIAKHVDYVIGMNQAIGDAAAIRFAEGFYDGLGYGRSCEEAFEFGLLAIEEEGIGEEDTPVLRVKGVIKSGDMGEKPLESLEEEAEMSTISGKQVFISYEQDVSLDESVALALYEALGQLCKVTINPAMPAGTLWAAQMEAELRRSDVLIVLLSSGSVGSEMLQQKVALAHDIAKENEGNPRILPVRLDYRQAFQYPLNEYLDPIDWAVWEGEDDTARLTTELGRAISGSSLSVRSSAQKQKILVPPVAEDQVFRKAIPVPFPSAQPQSLPPSVQALSAQQNSQFSTKPLELPEGTMEVESDFYVERPNEDTKALEAILLNGATITIKGPRQMGKSSLLNRVMAKAIEVGKQVTFIDFQLFDQTVLQNADEFYRQFCFLITDDLEIKDCSAEYWHKTLGNSQNCTRYFSRHILKSLDRPLVLAMDEVERIFETPFRNDFFSMLRSWHNQRATEKLWKNIDLALVTSTEPHNMIADINQSPFNVGKVLRLKDFNLEQVHELNVMYGKVLTLQEEQELISLVNGHPYLVRKAIYLVATGEKTAKQLFAEALDEVGPFGDHLCTHLFRVYGKTDLMNGLSSVLLNQTCPDEVIYSQLQGLGLVYRRGRQVVPRCKLYAQFMSAHLI